MKILALSETIAGLTAAAAMNVLFGTLVVNASVVEAEPANMGCICYVDLAMTERPSFPEIRDWNSLAITLHRGPCFGTCPIYSVTIHGDGRVEYEGGEFTGHPGKHEARIPVAKVRELFEKFRLANFFALKDSYRAPVTDNPSYAVTLRYDDHEKKVVDYVGRMAGMPLVVTELENAIDEAANTAQWATRPEPPQ